MKTEIPSVKYLHQSRLKILLEEMTKGIMPLDMSPEQIRKGLSTNSPIT